MFPGQADASRRANHNCQYAPAINQVQRSVARGRRGRTVVQPRVCFEKAKGVLGRKPQVQAPEHTQVGGQRATDPGQPQWPGWEFLVRQALDLDAHPRLNGASGVPATWRWVQPGVRLAAPS